MKFTEKMKTKLEGLIKAVSRFPLTTLFLIAAAVTNIIDINSDKTYNMYMVSFIVGSFLSAVAQVVFERYFLDKVSYRFILMGGAAALTLGYYAIVAPAPEFSMEIGIRTGVAMFALLIAFIWLPVTKREITFNESYLISFKSFFISLFFSLVIFAGTALILGAIDQLLFDITYKLYSYNATIVFFIFAPLFFLSMIPVFQDTRTEETEKAASIPRLLEVLISYIIIPLAAIFTVILVIYIFLNVRGEFWTNNLLEPMLVGYSITILLIYILASRIENNFAETFRKIAPKVLVPIVVFQIISSVMSLQEIGMTHGRYYAILYGVYAAIAGVILSIVPVKKNGLIAGILIVFSIISIVPPIDAFTVSRVSQINNLEEALTRNGMLENNIITPKADLANEDKIIIVESMNYLSMMDYTDRVPFLPEDYERFNDFYETFGFLEYDPPGGKRDSVYLNLDSGEALQISDYDFFTTTYFNFPHLDKDNRVSFINYSDMRYTLEKEMRNNEVFISLLDDRGTLIIEFSTMEIVNKFSNHTSVNNQITPSEATFITENDEVRLAFIVQDMFIDKFSGELSYGGTLHVLIDFK